MNQSPETGPVDMPEPKSEAATPAPRSFAEMNLDPAVKQALDEMGYEVPMEVQTAIYEKALAGKDLLVQSRTGSGKTAAFGIPIAQLVTPSVKGVQAIILAPTRELALQVSQEIGKICVYRNLQVVPVYGGAPMGRQMEALKAGAQIVAGTPGRVLDHLRRGTLLLGNVRILVLDECDEMLSMGFQEEIEKIIAELPRSRQTLLLSATVPEEIERIAKRHMRDYEKVVLSTGFVGVHEIHHQYYLVSGLTRTRDLLRVIEFEQPESAIIFCNTREDTAMVASFLKRHGYDAEAISSDLTQNERERVMARMREKNLRFLVATDVAARGIDISGLSHVVNYTFPESPEMYIHRTGRTGRAGKTGVAISLIGPREIGSFYYLKLLYKIKPEERELPTEAELRTRREADRFVRICQELTEDPGDDWRSLARRTWQSSDGERILATLLKRTWESLGTTPAGAKGEAKEEPASRSEATPSTMPAPVGDRPRPRPEAPQKERSARSRDRRPRTGEERGRPRDSEHARRGRDRSPERRDAPGAPPAAPAEREGSSTPSDEGREFWETWVEEKRTRVEESSQPSQIGERPEQGDAPRQRGRGEATGEKGLARLYFNVGKREGITSEQIASLLGEISPEAAASIHKVVLLGTHAYVTVKEEAADGVISAMRGRKIKDRELIVERAKR
ncbi:MAG: DEAD/DEAH box helicase [Deltaproteobacteria bacterium]|nr:DEAD/DEAH box helicase [Deltaproteobacteria bacterium]